MQSDSSWYQDPDALVTALRRVRPARPPPPQVEGYDVLDEIRSGGQGVVYLGRQHSTKRLVAIKVLHERAMASDVARRRFEREVDLVCGLRHPHIVTVYDSGRTMEQRPYLVMEFIEGRPLDQWINDSGPWPPDPGTGGTSVPPVLLSQEVRAGGGTDRRSPATEPRPHGLTSSDRATRSEGSRTRDPRLDPDAVLRLFTRICDAVSHAHQRGVIHRDLKPSNILIDEAGEPHVVDFGIARAAVGGGNDSRFTLTDQFLGTLAYASPEQLRGDPAAIDTRSDVYALGLILYLLLTGRLPHGSAASAAELVRSALEQVPPPPSVARRERGGGRPARIDDDLDTIVLKALAKEPQRRYQSADELRRDVEHYLRGEPIDAKRDSAAYVLRKLMLRHKAVSGLAAALLLAVVGFGAGMSLLYERARSEADKARQIRLFLEDTLSSVEPAERGRDVTVREVLDEAVHWAAVALADEPEIEASIRATIGNSYRALGRHAEAEAQVQRSLELRRARFGDEHPEVAHSLNLLGLLDRDRGRFESAEQWLRQGLAMRRRLLGDDHPDVGFSLNNLGLLMQDAGRLDEARQLLFETLQLRRRLYGDEHADTAMAQFRLAECLRLQGEMPPAEQLHRAALATRRTLLHAEHPDIDASLEALGSLLVAAGRAREAEPLLRECLALRQRRLPPDHPRVTAAEQALDQCRQAGTVPADAEGAGQP